MKLAIGIWRQTFGVLSKNPVIWLPFLIVGLFDAISLTLIFFAPQPPFSVVFAPPIRAFWGEQFLHYPLNLQLIPKLFNYAHIVVTAIVGVLMTGLAIGMLSEAEAGKKPKILNNFILAVVKYFIVLAIWLIVFILATLIYKIPNFLPIPIKNRVIHQILFYLGFFIVVFVQAIFIYAIPAAIVERKGLISAVKRGIFFFGKHFQTTLVLVLIPALFYIPVIILKGKPAALIVRSFPEIVLVTLGLGIVVSVLVDCIVTCSTTMLFLKGRQV